MGGSNIDFHTITSLITSFRHSGINLNWYWSNSERERGRVLAGEFNGEDSGVLTLLKEAALSVGHTVDKDKETGEEHVGSTDVET